MSVQELFELACAVTGATASIREDPRRSGPDASEVLDLRSARISRASCFGGGPASRSRTDSVRRRTGSAPTCRGTDQTSYMSEQAIPLRSPAFKATSELYLDECIRSNYVSSIGPFVERFEREFAAYVGSDYAVACSSGTSALHVALRVLGVERGDEVFVPTSRSSRPRTRSSTRALSRH